MEIRSAAAIREEKQYVNCYCRFTINGKTLNNDINPAKHRYKGGKRKKKRSKRTNARGQWRDRDRRRERRIETNKHKTKTKRNRTDRQKEKRETEKGTTKNRESKV